PAGPGRGVGGAFKAAGGKVKYVELAYLCRQFGSGPFAASEYIFNIAFLIPNAYLHPILEKNKHFKPGINLSFKPVNH
ncbi:MAG: hypothetical protein KDH84_25525, partial [Calditrichaeota bacterium]|nr:hypothetical protein [Calditrichota bacterium]